MADPHVSRLTTSLEAHLAAEAATLTHGFVWHGDLLSALALGGQRSRHGWAVGHALRRSASLVSACGLRFPFLYLAPIATLSSGAYSSHLLFRRKQESIVEPIVAPEHLGPDEKGRRTEDALRTGLLRLVAEPRFDRFGLSPLCKTQVR